MAGRQEIKVTGPSYQLADRKAAVQRAVNLYLRQVEGLGEDRTLILDSTPGLRTVADVGATIRGSYNAFGRWFIVAGSILYETQTDGSRIQRGMLSSSFGFVSMKSGRDQLVIVDGPSGYVLNLTTNVFNQITDPDWRGSTWVEELDGYFIFVPPSSDQFYLSAIDDGSNFDALDFSSADAQPDNIITHRVKKRELFLFGMISTEVWINSGDPDFPFVRYNSTPIDVGIVGNRAAIFAGDTLLFVGQTVNGAGYVYEMQGHQPVRVSTQAVEESMQASTDLSGVTMWTYQTDGNEFVAINAPGVDTTWVFDFSTRQWHERADFANGKFEQLRAEFVTFVGGDHFACGGSVIYRLDDTYYQNGSDILARERTWPHLVTPSLEPISYRGLELQCKTGQGGNITLEISNDGGYVWGPPLLRSLGATGRRNQRVRWLLLGSGTDRVFRLRTTDAVPMTIYSAALDA